MSAALVFVLAAVAFSAFVLGLFGLLGALDRRSRKTDARRYEVSMGYTCTVDPKTGEQRFVNVHHIAETRRRQP